MLNLSRVSRSCVPAAAYSKTSELSRWMMVFGSMNTRAYRPPLKGTEYDYALFVHRLSKTESYRITP